MRSAVATLVLSTGLFAGVAMAQDQGATVVAPLDVLPNLAPVPAVGSGAPLLSVGELQAAKVEANRLANDQASASRRCFRPSPLAPFVDDPRDPEHPTLAKTLRDAEAANRLAANAAEAASAATSNAVAARVAMARGEVGQKAVDDAELARQAAVRRYLALRADAREAEAVANDRMQVKLEQMRDRVRPWEVKGEMAVRAADRYFAGAPDDIVIRRPQGLALVDVTASEKPGRRGPTLVVTGRVRNQAQSPAPMPPLSLTAVDQNGAALRTELSDPRRGTRIPPGGDIAFTYEFQPKPQAARSVLITFGAGRTQAEPAMLGMVCEGGHEWPKTDAEAASSLQSYRGAPITANRILGGAHRGPPVP